MTRTAVVAFGGNALVAEAGRESIPDQYDTVIATIPSLVDLIERKLAEHGVEKVIPDAAVMEQHAR